MKKRRVDFGRVLTAMLQLKDDARHSILAEKNLLIFRFFRFEWLLHAGGLGTLRGYGVLFESVSKG